MRSAQQPTHEARGRVWHRELLAGASAPILQVGADLIRGAFSVLDGAPLGKSVFGTSLVIRAPQDLLAPGTQSDLAFPGLLGLWTWGLGIRAHGPFQELGMMLSDRAQEMFRLYI
jgi:hypothetical protein